MLSAELYPFAKTGGLADAVRGLADGVFRRGLDIRVIVPEYRIIKGRIPLAAGVLPLGFENIEYGVHRITELTDFPLLAIDAPALFQRNGLYGETPDSEYVDNVKRFSLFYRAALHHCRDTGWVPDIIHVHDWHAAPALAYRTSIWRRRQAGVLTIHNYGYRGYFAKHDIHYTGLEKESFAPTGSLRRRTRNTDTLSFLGCGILHADSITTVSPTYAREIESYRDDDHSAALASRGAPVVGILNGIDYGIWDPAADPLIPFAFTSADLSGKTRCKEDLQRRLGLPVDPGRTLIGMIARLVSQKGIDLLLRRGILSKICRKLPVQLAILGSGEPWAEEALRRIARNFRSVSVTIGFDEALAHRIEAGSDFFLMPSRYEPCGLNQMYSLAYGSLPIVTPVGGLADTVENYDPAGGRGTGFFISPQTAHGLYAAVKTAVGVWNTRNDDIDTMRTRAMSRKFTWDRAASEYERLYSSILD
jgi:starch synthase